MAKSLKQVLDQIDKLQREAEDLRRKEIAGVIARIQEAIAHYGLKPADLFESNSQVRRASSAKGPRAARSSRPAKYISEDGRTWSGVGKRPAWFNEALAAGKSPGDLLVGAESSGMTAAVNSLGRSSRGRKSVARKAAAKKEPGQPKYQDDSGKTWTGRGKRPAWFVQALADGKSPEDLLIPSS